MKLAAQRDGQTNTGSVTTGIKETVSSASWWSSACSRASKAQRKEMLDLCRRQKSTPAPIQKTRVQKTRRTIPSAALACCDIPLYHRTPDVSGTYDAGGTMPVPNTRPTLSCATFHPALLSYRKLAALLPPDKECHDLRTHIVSCP